MRFFNVSFIILLLLASCTKEVKNNTTETLPFSEENSLLLKKDLDSLKNYPSQNDDSLMLFSEEIISHFPGNKAHVYIKIGYTFYAKSNLYLTKHCFTEAANQYLKDSNQALYAEQLSNIGVMEELTGNYPKAIEIYFEALSIFEKENLPLKSESIYNNLGIVYQKLNNKEKSLENYKKALVICLENNREDLAASKYNNIATIFEQFYGNLDSALFYYQKSYGIFSADSLHRNTPTIQANIANIYIGQNKLQKADSLLSESLKLSIKTDNTYAINLVNEFKTTLLLKQKKFKEAEFLALKTIEIAKKEQKKEHELNGLKILTDCYANQGDYLKSYENLLVYNKLKEEFTGEKQKNEINKLNVRFDVQQKDNKIEVLEIQKQASRKRNTILGIITFLIILTLLILLYAYILQKKHSILKMENMEHEISNYIKQIHDFEEKEHEDETSKEELFLDKVKQFNLTDREEKVLLLISEGYKNAEIADKMFVSVNTIKTHIKNLFIKLEVRNRTEATNIAKSA